MGAVCKHVRAVDFHRRENRERLARMLVQLFDHWQLSASDRASLLGLSPASRATVARYRNGEPLANNTDLLARAAHLLGIHKALRIMFPHDRDLVYRWVSTPNRRFGDRKPLEILKQGYEGILAVRRYLDFEAGPVTRHLCDHVHHGKIGSRYSRGHRKMTMKKEGKGSGGEGEFRS